VGTVERYALVQMRSLWRLSEDCQMTKDFWEGYVPEPTIKKSLTVEATLKLALEALEGIHPGNMTPMAEEYWNKAITAIKQALAAPVQEPVAWVTGFYAGRCVIKTINPAAILPVGVALYTTPPAAQPAIPDAIGPNEDELPAYAAGWNDCRAEMLKERNNG
jgi:hypothetical protein